MATSRAIDAMNDPSFQAFADALVDRVSAIVGNHQLRIIDAHAAFDQSLAEIRFQLAEVNRHAEADRRDRQTITKFLERMDARWEAMNSVVIALRGDADLLRHDVDGLQQDRQTQYSLIDQVLARLSELEASINGRLTQLIDEARVSSRAEGRLAGRDEERAHPGVG